MSNDEYAIVECPWGEMEAWKARSIAKSLTQEIREFRREYAALRNDAATEAKRADEAEAQKTLIRHLRDQVTEHQRRFDAYVARQDAIEAKRSADAARQAKFDEEDIEFPPDLGKTPPSRATADDTPLPDGHLHAVTAKDPEDPEDPEIEDDQGDLPAELTKGVAPAPSSYPSFELPKPPVVSQPVSISLNKE